MIWELAFIWFCVFIYAFVWKSDLMYNWDGFAQALESGLLVGTVLSVFIIYYYFAK